jgi:carbon-monoxide dehydrogenase medium subunit
MKHFEYRKPGSLAEAVSILGAHDDAVAIAGGMTLLPTMKQRLAEPAVLVDLTGISQMKSVSVAPDAVTIGALVRHAEVARSPEVKAAIPALAALAGDIGDPQVRNRGTLGGSVANADPAADYPAAVVGLDATIITNQREIPADAFFTGLFETVLQAGELITAVRFRKPQAAAYAKFANPASRYAIVGVLVAKFAAGVRVAITGAGPSVFRHAALEAALAARFEPSAIDGVVVSAAALNSDIHAEAAYRAHLIGVMAKRAVARAPAPGRQS